MTREVPGNYDDLTLQEADDLLNKVKTHLLRLKEELKAHILERHGNVIAQACHRCGSLLCGIKADEDLIARLEQRINALRAASAMDDPPSSDPISNR